MALTSVSAWAQCAVPGAINVGPADICTEFDINRTSNTAPAVAVQGAYSGTNIAIETAGFEHHGFYITGTGTVDLSGGAIETDGEYAFGFKLEGGTLSVSDYRITTLDDNADGFVLKAPVFVELDNVQITTHGSSSSGIEAEGGSTVEGSNVTIRTGQSAASLTEGVRIDDGTVTLRSSAIEVMGADSSGIAVWQGDFYGEDIRI